MGTEVGWSGEGQYEHNGCTYDCYLDTQPESCVWDADDPASTGCKTVTELQTSTSTGDEWTGDPSGYEDVPDDSEPECDIQSASTGECLDKDMQPDQTCPSDTTEGEFQGETICMPNSSDDGGDDGSSGGDDGSGGDTGGGGDDGSGGDDGGDSGSGSSPDGSTTTGTITLPDGTTHEVEFDTEGLAQESTNQEIRDELKDLTDDEGATDEPKNQFNEQSDESWDESGIEDNIDEVEQGEYDRMGGREDADGLGSMVGDAIPDVGCSGISMDLYGGHSWTISCADLAEVRGILRWVFYVLTAVGIFQVIFETTGGRA